MINGTLVACPFAMDRRSKISGRTLLMEEPPLPTNPPDCFKVNLSLGVRETGPGTKPLRIVFTLDLRESRRGLGFVSEGEFLVEVEVAVV
ncbi:hypothetical protein FOTG_18548 [Fusarium oxysporum f. sp. vasinfectum 25433]|uniref:Uncharacterized protein n=1 Tax=Fusarium oxysporum f. sp. vasinfectum 25433 TaxID=1089449 RepID=X0KWB6_FUSOX|nr:hypothetical protein FOTG_18548 [Fusarium oxysporum f. sp. vasinfectum 25433]